MRRESVLGSCSCSGPVARVTVSPLSVLLHSSVSPEAKGSSESRVKSEEADLRRGVEGKKRETAGGGGGGRGPAAEPLQKSRTRASWYWSVWEVSGSGRPYTGCGVDAVWSCARTLLLVDERIVSN